MDGDIKLNAGEVKIEGDQLRAAVPVFELGARNGAQLKGVSFDAGGTLSVNGSKLQAEVAAAEIGSHASGAFKGIAVDAGGTVAVTGGKLQAEVPAAEIGSHAGGAFKGIAIDGTGTVAVTGAKLRAEVPAAEIGSHAGGKFKGIAVSASGYLQCSTYALVLNNPDGPQDSQMRMAMAQTSADELMINVNAHYKDVNIFGPVLITTPGVKKVLPNGQVVTEPATVMNLLDTIHQLQARVAALEKAK
jgi:hypothetical protein